MTFMTANYTPRNLHPPKESYFLFGPRGTGKSTWLINQYPKARRIDLLLAEEERRLLSYPERIRREVETMMPGSVLILDEIQRVPRLLPEIHALIEEKRGIQFILTGSSARKLRRSSSDLLGGRAEVMQMGPFIASELGSEFNLSKALRTGMIPLVWCSTDPQDRLKNYLQLYVKEEVQAEGLVRKIGDFSRFLEVASFSCASLWTATDIGREANIKRSTINNYFQILEELFLSFSLPVFSKKAKRRLVSHSKFYFFDVGVYRFLRPQGILDNTAEIEGVALETLVAQHLRSWVFSQNHPHSFCFWRTQTKLEVDFVIYGPKGFWAIEVKRSENLGPDDFRAMKAFQEEYPQATCFFVTYGKRRERVRGFDLIPAETFLRQLVPDGPIFTKT